MALAPTLRLISVAGHRTHRDGLPEQSVKSVSGHGNDLALRLSRYRLDDPFVAGESRREQWARRDSPSLEPTPDDVFEVNIPGYETHRLFFAEDPLVAANAFAVQIRTVLATMLGVRRCPRCPHCDFSS